jgi:GNAT superfamily N-acetyltransferase
MDLVWQLLYQCALGRGALAGTGGGTQLLQAAEQEARARGCQHMILDSYNFQAPGFYQKHGYEVFAVLEEHPRHHRNYYLWKRLS